jgi:pimeloyl-ACP methyl ester carboxylesterase
MGCHGRRTCRIALIVVGMTTQAAFGAGPESDTQHRMPAVRVAAQSSCGGEALGSDNVTVEETTLRGVPAIVRTPAVITQPPVLLLHGFGSPASPVDLMRALPLDDVPAPKVYLWLPLFGPRAGPGGKDELVRRQMKDFVSLLFEPAVIGAANELPGIVDELRQRRCYGKVDEVSLFGFSAGGSAVLYALIHKGIRVHAAVILNTPPNLDSTLSALKHATGSEYRWSIASRRTADSADAISHARDIAAGNQPPPLLVLQGADDSVIGPSSAMTLEQALRPHYQHDHDERLQVVVFPGVSHEWIDSAAVDAIRKRASTWFNLPWE